MSLVTMFSIKTLSDFAWILPFCAVALVALWLSLVQRRVYHQAMQHFRQTPSVWDDAVLAAVYIPAQCLIWFLSALVAFSMAQEAWDRNYWSWIDPLFREGVLFFLVWTVWRLIGLVQHNATQSMPGRKTIHPSTAAGIARLARIIWICIGGVLLLHGVGVEMTGLVAFGSVGGIVLGLAAQTMLSNLFGSMMIYFDRPFQIGDWVRSPDRDIEGTVEEIGWRLTRIRTHDGRPLYVPNAAFTTIALENPSRMAYRRIVESITIAYSDWTKIATALSEVRDMLQKHHEVDHHQNNWCHVTNYGPSALQITLQAYTKATDTLPFRKAAEHILLDVLAILQKHHIDVAIPSSIVHVPEPVQTLALGPEQIS